jgi:hypothetical protein
MSSDGLSNLFPTADRKTVAVRPNSIGCETASEPRPKRGRRRTELVERQEREFVQLLTHGLRVNEAQAVSGLTDQRALRIVAELFEGLREAA